MDDYRVFISYSHLDGDSIDEILDTLENNGLVSTYDKNLGAGMSFREQIESMISHSDVFIPVLSENSSQAGWVHQEIGYAMAMNIPILPIAIDDTIPDQMIQELHALRWDGTEDEKNFRINNYVSVLEIEKSRPTYEFADYQEDRTEMMVDYAKNITILGFHGKVRQMAGLSSFHIPRDPIYDETWLERYDGQEMPTHYTKDLLRKERLILEKHVESEGCSLIINSDFKFGSDVAKNARLEQLINFLKYRSDQDNIKIVIDEIPPGRNLTIVGDWFFADAFKATLDDGYFQTIFSRHAPTVRKKIREFDHRFEKLLKKQGSEKTSLEDTINILEEIKSNLI